MNRVMVNDILSTLTLFVLRWIIITVILTLQDGTSETSTKKKHTFLLLSQNGCIMQCSVTTWVRYPTWLPLADSSATECGAPDSWSEPPLALQPRSLPSSLPPPAPSPPAAVGTGGKSLQPCLCLGWPGSKNTMYSIQMLKTKMCVHVITVHALIVAKERGVVPCGTNRYKPTEMQGLPM